MADKKIRKRDCVRLSNKIIDRCQLDVPTVTVISDIRSNLFVSLLEVLTQQLPPGIISNPASPADEVHNIQTIINHLALDLINVDLSHISAANIIGGDPRAIYNLLEIFCGLHKYFSSHELDRWNLEESLTETEEELSTSSSSSSSPAAGSPPPEQVSTRASTSSSSSSSPAAGSPPPEQDDEAVLAAGKGKSPSAEAVASNDSERPSKTPSRRSSAGGGGVRGSASAGSRPPSSGGTPGGTRGGTPGGTRGGTPGGTPGSRGGSPARRRSADSPAQPPSAALSRSGSGSATAPSTKTSTSGGSAAAVSFPESQYSLEMELPISKSGGRDPAAPHKPRPELASDPASPAAVTSSSQETPGDAETPADEETPADVESPGDEGTPVAEPERGQETPPGDGETSEGAMETARSSESTAPDSPTTETGETEETGETKETEETGETGESGESEEPAAPHELNHFQFADEQTPDADDGAGGDEYNNTAFDADSDIEVDPFTLTDLQSDEEVVSEGDTEVDEDGNEDISRQLSQELQQLQQQQTSSGPEQTSSGADKKERKKPSTPPGTSSDPARSRPARSAPCAAAVRRCRSSDRSSASDPGVNGRRPLCRRLLTRNIETIAEIHESGGERAVTRTTREQAGDKLCKETVQREVRRKVHSAPQPTTRNMSFSKQSSRRSICSDGVLRWLESQGDTSFLKVEGQETDVFEFLRREFPYVRVSEETKRKLLNQYRHQMKYIMHLVEPTSETRNYSIRRQDVLKRQALLTDIIRQQKLHDQRFRRLKDTRLQTIKRRNAPRDARISCLRAQRFVDSFKQQFESRMALNKSREELLMKAVFEEMLEIQRHRLRSVRALEKRAIREFYGEDGYTSELNRMHQFYEANFRDLAQMLSKEKTDLQISQKEQLKLADRIKREFRGYMEADVKSLNDKVVTSWQPQYRELDADRIRSDLYEANWKFCVT